MIAIPLMIFAPMDGPAELSVAKPNFTDPEAVMATPSAPPLTTTGLVLITSTPMDLMKAAPRSSADGWAPVFSRARRG